jgi:hypothetical protein
MTEVTNLRLYIMRGTYLLMFVGLAFAVWPGIIQHALRGDPAPGATHSLLAAVGALAILGIRYPLQMLPLMLFELLWKSIWMIAVALPLWSVNQIDASTMSNIYDCLMGLVIFPLVIPWPYVLANYPQRPSDRWM